MATAANIEKLEVEIEVQCSAEKFYRMYKHKAKDIPKHIPHHYEAVEILKGDGISVRSVKRWHYVLEEGGKCLNALERTKVVDDEKRTITHSVFEGEVMNDYKFLEITLAVTPNKDGHSSVVKWIVEYEKANEDSPAPTAIIEFKKRATRDLIVAIAANIEKLEVEIEVQCSAEKFYRMYTHAAKDIPKHIPHHYEAVEILEGDGISVGSVKRWHYVLEEGGKCLNALEKTTMVDDEKRIVTYSIFEGEIMNDYKFLEITLAVTPKNDGHGSVVKWIVEYEKANEDSPAPTAIIEFKKRATRDLINAHPLLHKHN